MPDCDELLSRAKAAPASLRFGELCQLAECFDFIFRRQKGSHRAYARPGWPRPMTFQDEKGMAKPYQVRQLLAAIELIQSGQDERET